MKNICSLLGVTLCAVGLLGVPAARASFHLMQIEEVVGGVDGDTTAQAIQLRMRADGQSFLHSDEGGPFGPAGLIAYDANGANPVMVISFPNDVANGVTGDRVLITSATFAGHLATPVTADFAMSATIPAQYLSAGRLDYVDGKGDVLWSLAFGGASYRGPLAGSVVNGQAGTPFAGAIPGAGSSALQFQGTATAMSVSNATDYLVTASAATVTNNAGASGQISGSSTLLPTVTVAALVGTVSEAETSKGKLVVTRTGNPVAALTVKYKVDGQAVAGVNYQLLSGNVVIPAGKARATIKVKPLDDHTADGKKSVKVTLLPDAAYTLGTAVKAKVTILDAD